MLFHLKEVYAVVTSESKQMTFPSLMWQLGELRGPKGVMKPHDLSSGNLQTEFWSKEICANGSFAVN